MGPGEHRPYDHEYWTRPWSTTLFAGDLFEAVPFGDQPTAVYVADDAPEGRHFIAEISFGYGLLITPTCDMTVQSASGGPAHPFRTLVPVVPLALVIEQVSTLDENLLRSRDVVRPYMYLPPLRGAIEEDAVACLYRPGLVSDSFLADPPKRVGQLLPEARRHLKVKLAAYWARVEVDPDQLPLKERDEDQAKAEGWPPSEYDDPAGPTIEPSKG